MTEELDKTVPETVASTTGATAPVQSCQSRPIFDAETHTYTSDGKVLPSVTQILARLGTNCPHWTEESRQRGQAVHAAIALIHEERLDDDSLDDRIKPYVFQYRQFQTISGFRPLVWEGVVGSASLGYAGTIDCIGELNGRKVLMDWKTGSVPSTVAAQLAAYHVAANECGVLGSSEGLGCYALKLEPRRFRLVHVPADALDVGWQQFVQALGVKK